MVSVCPPAPAGRLSAMRTSSPGQGRHSAMRAPSASARWIGGIPSNVACQVGPRSSSQVSAPRRANAGSARRRSAADSVSVDRHCVSRRVGSEADVDHRLGLVDAHAGGGDRLAGEQWHVDHHRGAGGRLAPDHRLDLPLQAQVQRARDAQERRQRHRAPDSSGARLGRAAAGARQLEALVGGAVLVQPVERPAAHARGHEPWLQRQRDRDRLARRQRAGHLDAERARRAAPATACRRRCATAVAAGFPSTRT